MENNKTIEEIIDFSIQEELLISEIFSELVQKFDPPKEEILKSFTVYLKKLADKKEIGFTEVIYGGKETQFNEIEPADLFQLIENNPGILDSAIGKRFVFVYSTKN